MNDAGSPRRASCGCPASLLLACVVLTTVVLLAWPVFAWVGFRHSGTAGVWAAVVAAAICWGGALAALLLAGWSRHGRHALSGVLAGMLFRMGLPLGAGLALHWRGGRLADARVFGMILVYYFVTLITETLLSVRLVARKRGRSSFSEGTSETKAS